MAGKLYLCATPIGNLEDITLRVLRTLREVDLIAAEDTRNSIKLLNHFGIRTSMTSYHEYNKYDKAAFLIQEIKNGKNVALITDAGTPAVSDPGEALVKMCYEEGVEVTSLPGAAACITALTLSGKSTRRFCFEAFLPADKKERRAVLEELKRETRTIVLYEAPHRLLRTVQELLEALGNREASFCRELTKKYEEARQMTLEEAVAHYREQPPKGEFVIVLSGRTMEDVQKESRKGFLEMSLAEHVSYYEAEGYERKEAMRMAAKDRGVSKRDVYQGLLGDG